MKLDIVLAVPGMAFNGQTFDKQSLGGSETAGYYMARALAKLGHNVTVFCNTEQSVRTVDVDYHPIDMFQSWAEFTQHDVCIVQRLPQLFMRPIKCRYGVLWCHDLAQIRTANGPKAVAWNYDDLFLLSKFQMEQYREVLFGTDEFKVADHLLFQTRNGVCLDTVKKARETNDALVPKPFRNLKALLYTARPERGLDVLLAEVMPRILKKEPDAKLFLATYDNTVPEMAGFYAKCEQLAAILGPGVVKNLKALPKGPLYSVMLNAGVLAYPVPSSLMPDFDEISCITAMEAQACGLPMVSTARGALTETLHPDAGILVDKPVLTDEYYDAFAEACLKLMQDPEANTKASEAGRAHAEANLGWDAVAVQWTERFLQGIRKNSADLATMANHFWRKSDIYAAEECIKRINDMTESPVKAAQLAKVSYVAKHLKEHFSFIHEENGFRDQYERIGGGVEGKNTGHDPAVINASPREPRFHALGKWLMQTFFDKDLKVKPEFGCEFIEIVDYGCAHGGYALNLLKQLPKLKIVGVDIDLHSIEMANKFAEDLGVADRWTGVVGDYTRLSDPNLPEFSKKYHAALAQEVLEHVPHPEEVIRALEDLVMDGGRVYVTVPFGAWEYSSYYNYPWRCHIWEFDPHDLDDLLKPKKAFGDEEKKAIQLSMSMVPAGQLPEMNDAVGWIIVNYVVTAKTRGAVGKIDLDRKLWLNRPRQTLSVVMMIGGADAHETILWAVNPLQYVADELVIVDCGMSPLCKQLLEASVFNDGRLKIVPGVDPKTQGFETPRNIGVAEATQDWIYWVDGDERTLQPNFMHKYLRENVFNAYSIHQHHFAVDTGFPADLPSRLFRNVKAEHSCHKPLRFYGMIHEHPETELNKGSGFTVLVSDVHIAHMGYLIESGRKVKFHRNLPMLEADKKKYPDRKLQKHFIMRESMIMAADIMRMNGGQLDAAVTKLCEETIEVYRAHFLGKGFFTNQDPIIYYNAAVSLLSSKRTDKGAMGFDMAFSLGFDKVGAVEGPLIKSRFATVEDAVAEVSYRIRNAAEIFEKRWY